MNQKHLEEIRKLLVDLHNAVDVDEEMKHYIFNVLKIEWLIQRAEKAQVYEDTLKYCQFQLKNGGQGKRTRITLAVDKALEGTT